MANAIVTECIAAMKSRIQGLEKDLGRVRTGRANIQMLDGIKVHYYGKPTPLNQVASLATPDARTIVITPFEKKSISDIEKAIHIADIGITPASDGNVVRLPVPPLNEERRKEIAKSIRKYGEEAKVAIRKIRQDANNAIKKAEKQKEIGEDESSKVLKVIQTETDLYSKQIDDKITQKEKEVLSM